MSNILVPFLHNEKQCTSKRAHLFLVSCQWMRQWQWGLAGWLGIPVARELAGHRDLHRGGNVVEVHPVWNLFIY